MVGTGIKCQAATGNWRAAMAPKAMKFFSSRKRPVHLGGYPLEKLNRLPRPLTAFPSVPLPVLSFDRPETPESIVNAMGPFQAMMDVLRTGPVNPVRAVIPDDPQERAHHLKAFGYYNDASMMGVCALPDAARLAEPVQSPGTDALARDLRERQTKTLAAGVDVIMANLRDAASAPATPLPAHSHALVVLSAYPRDPRPDEPGATGSPMRRRNALPCAQPRTRPCLQSTFASSALTPACIRPPRRTSTSASARLRRG